MNQSVIAFSNATARSSAITSPVEGMITYLEDSNSYQSYDGARWVGLVAQSPNAIINGAFEINQRGFTSSVNPVEAFGFDRWNNTGLGDGTATFTAQSFTPGAAPIAGYEAMNFIRCLTTGQSSAGVLTRIEQKIEDVRSFAGQSITVSFFAKSNTGTPNLNVAINQNFGSGGSSAVTTVAPKFAINSSWSRYFVSLAVPSVSGKTIGGGSSLRLRIQFSAGSDFASASDSLGIQSNTFDIWGVQVEAGPVATPFRRNANSLQGELAACQRYYNRVLNGSVGFAYLPLGYYTTSTNVRFSIPLSVQLRVPPTSLDFSNLLTQNNVGNGGVSAVTFLGGGASNNYPMIEVTTGAQTAGNIAFLLANGSTGFLGFSAEL